MDYLTKKIDIIEEINLIPEDKLTEPGLTQLVNYSTKE